MRLIDADALRDEAVKAQNREDTNSYINMGLAIAVELIDNAPTVDTTFRELVAYECGKNDRPKGKWIEYDEDELYTGECSCCKWKALLYESNVLNMNFCPNCGADMRSVDKGLHERAVCDLSKTVDDLYKKLRGDV